MSRIALLIGVNKTRAGHLRAPENDVSAWVEQLHRVGFDEVIALASPSTATADAAARAFVARLAEAGAEAQGFFFFAGHGVLRARASASLFCADTEGQAAPGTPGTLASHGALHLDQLHDTVLAQAPGASLLAVVDACRVFGDDDTLQDTPAESIRDAWSRHHFALITAAQIGQSSYERWLDGRPQGLLTWALLALLGQWQRGSDAEGAYIELSLEELVARAGQLIAPLSPTSEPQVPVLYASDKGKATAVFHYVGRGRGVTAADPKDAPSHEWEGDVCGIIQKNGGDYGYFRSDFSKNVSLQLLGPLPAATDTLTFNRVTPKSALVPQDAVRTFVAPAFTPVAPGTPPASLLVSADQKTGLHISGTTWNWYIPPNTAAQNANVLGDQVTLSTGTLAANIANLKKVSDVFTEAVGPWGVPKLGRIRSDNVDVGAFQSTADGVVTLSFNGGAILDPASQALRFVVDPTAVLVGTCFITTTAAAWTWVPTAPQSLHRNALRDVGLASSVAAGGQSATFTFYAVVTGTSVRLPNDCAFAVPTGALTVPNDKDVYRLTLSFVPDNP